MLDAIKPLLESGIVNESTRAAIAEAWDNKLLESREQVRAELREEFAQRYQQDKKVMVESLDKMVADSLHKEIAEFAEEKQGIIKDRVRFNRKMAESSNKFNRFLVSKLAEEIQELRRERQGFAEAATAANTKIKNFVIETLAKEMHELYADKRSLAESKTKIKNFVIRSLAEEIQEFFSAKKSVVETRVKLLAEAKQKFDRLQSKFIHRSAALVKEAVTSNLTTELTQLKEDITLARENMFGRQLFEAFASEFAATHLNENNEIAKLTATNIKKDRELKEAKKIAVHKSRLNEANASKIRALTESTQRKEKMSTLLSSLTKHRATVMTGLLESVQTDKLQSAFEKYLPAVLNGVNDSLPSKKAALTETRQTFTGDRSARNTVKDQNIGNVEITDIKRLAGLK